MRPIRRGLPSRGIRSAWCAVTPGDVLNSVTVAVDATAAVVDEVPDNGLLLAHHPLLLRRGRLRRGQHPEGCIVHRLIRTGRSLFTAHTNADSAAPGVSDALAHALGLTVEAVLEPLSGAGDLDKWVVYVPRGERGSGAGGRVCGRGRPHRRLFAVQLERHRYRTVPAA